MNIASGGTFKFESYKSKDGSKFDNSISQGFINDMIEDPVLSGFIKEKGFYFEDSYFRGKIEIRSNSIKAIHITNCVVEVALTIFARIEDGLVIQNLKGGNLITDKINADNIEIDDSKLLGLFLENIVSQGLHLSNVYAGTAIIDNVHLSDVLSISQYDGVGLIISNLKSNSAGIETKKLYTLAISGSDFGSGLYLDTLAWGDNSGLILMETTGSSMKWILHGSVPRAVGVTGATFNRLDWGTNPIAILQRTTAKGVDASTGIYDVLAQTYSEEGRNDLARAVLIERENAIFRFSHDWWEKAYLWLSWVLAGYGYRPEFGIAWVLVFVGLGTVIFWSGEKSVLGGRVPKNWLVYAIDSVLPGIKLDDAHAGIGFKGWRQYYLYFHRFLGAVVVVLIFAILRRSFGN